MLKKEQYEDARIRAVDYFKKAGIIITGDEERSIEIADFNLSDLEMMGLEVLVYVNTKRVCAKEIVMFPLQTCPEHRHPNTSSGPGKEETFRCRYGRVYLYVPGEPAPNPNIKGLENYTKYLSSMHEIILEPGDQYILIPDTLHWFRAGDIGAVVSEFSTTSTDEQDQFTDPSINRFTRIGD